MVTFGQLETSDVVLALATTSLQQLFRLVAIPSCGSTSLNADDLAKYFNLGESVTLSQIKKYAEADSVDPRSAAITYAEAEYTNTTLSLERLFHKGYKTYSMDAQVDRYIRDFSEVTAEATKTSVDNYFYNAAFRDYSDIPSTGVVNLSAAPPLAIVSKEDPDGLTEDFGKTHLIRAQKVLDSLDVPSMGRCARIGSTAKAGFLEESTNIVGSGGGMLPINAAGSFVETGFPQQLSVMRYDFELRGSNAITGQTAVTNLGDGNAVENITAVAADTTVFFDGTNAVSTPLGAVKLTLGITAAFPPGLAVGAIARIAPASDTATAYGVILRVDSATKAVWLVPYSQEGNKLVAAQITAGTDLFSIPAIDEINIANHRQSFVYASRLLKPPTPGSGAIMASQVDPETGLVMNVLKGDYSAAYLTENMGSLFLCGAKAVDYRKAVLMIS
jgi:hypothetical protein